MMFCCCSLLLLWSPSSVTVVVFLVLVAGFCCCRRRCCCSCSFVVVVETQRSVEFVCFISIFCRLEDWREPRGSVCGGSLKNRVKNSGTSPGVCDKRHQKQVSPPPPP